MDILSTVRKAADSLGDMVPRSLGSPAGLPRLAPLEFRHDLDRRRAAASEKTRAGAETALRLNGLASSGPVGGSPRTHASLDPADDPAHLDDFDPRRAA